MVTLGDETAPKSVLYVGTHHGMEWITTLFLLRFINEYCEYYKGGKQAFGINLGTLFATRCIRVIPMLNVDGAQLQIHGVEDSNPLKERLERMSGGDYSKWQANARGVDLNHNYNAGFAEYKKLEAEANIMPGPTRFSGENPESEPETGALCNYIRFNGVCRMILTFHTARRRNLLYIWGIRSLPQQNKLLPSLEDCPGIRFPSLRGWRLMADLPIGLYRNLTVPRLQ